MTHGPATWASAVVGYHAQPPLQLVYGIVGMSILLAALVPALRTHLVGRGSRG